MCSVPALSVYSPKKSPLIRMTSVLMAPSMMMVPLQFRLS